MSPTAHRSVVRGRGAATWGGVVVGAVPAVGVHTRVVLSTGRPSAHGVWSGPTGFTV